ncbi:hypothetical protein SEA_BOLT007_39 [Arthrobacter phage Bolt007]|uniref:Uncharacterized protein n=1 Tax=Arthrobacter phage Bolt007 TaxID=3017297 RepID=A0AA49E468_9CAUD|nr:hypothetical protein SEA_BOLT007_39 [Arthrobacter phage Bolt007]
MRKLAEGEAQTIDDLLEDVVLDLAREIVKVQCLAMGQGLDRAERILSGPDAELILLHPRNLVEPHVRRAIEKALKAAGVET